MSKYIGPNKLIEIIEEIKKTEYENCGGVNAKTRVLQEVQELIESLQQEQAECSSRLVDIDAVREDFITEVYRVLDADSTNDRANAIIDAFDSLPTVFQEQPKIDLVAELRHHLATTSKEQLEKEWKELEKWNDVGPTVREFLCGKQPDVDLEKCKKYDKAFTIAKAWYKSSTSSKQERHVARMIMGDDIMN